MRRWKRGTGVVVLALALQASACGTDIAPLIETERRFQGVAQGPPPAPQLPFDMSLFLRKLATGQQGVTGGFDVNNGQVRGSVVGTLTGTLDEGTFSGRLIAAEGQSALARAGAPRGSRGSGAVFGLVFVPAALVMASRQGVGCVVEQQYTGTVTTSGISWTPGALIRSCPTNPLNFTLQATSIIQEGTTSVSSTSTTPTTSTTSTTTTTVPTTTSVSTTSTTSTSTTTSVETTTTSTTTTIRPLGQP